jgi:hypothetical protein
VIEEEYPPALARTLAEAPTISSGPEPGSGQARPAPSSPCLLVRYYEGTDFISPIPYPHLTGVRTGRDGICTPFPSRAARLSAEILNLRGPHARCGGYRGSDRLTGFSCYNSLEDDPFSGTFSGRATPESPASALARPRDRPSHLWVNC